MIFVFGDCELDLDLRELRRGGGAHAVEPQVFDLLLYLIENRERVVSKDDLFDAIWEGRVVSEANLSNRINLARQAIGDNGKKQDFIRTYPRRGFRFVGDVEARKSGNGSAAPAPAPVVEPHAPEHLAASGKPSIAVLPFDNLSGDPEQEYFSDGITEDIITALSHVRQFFVTARHTTFAYKDHRVNVQAVASELGVRYVLEGSVRKVGDRVRISAQLIDGETGNHLWAERYDRDLADIFAVQDEITQTVVGALQPELTRSEIERARRKPTESLNAWDFYQRGLWHFFRANKEDNAAAVKLFSKAIELDSVFVAPYVGMAECYSWESFYSNTERDAQAIFAAARKAVEIDPQDANAHKALGMAHFANRDPSSAIAEYKMAIQLNPSAAHSYAWLGWAQSFSGRAEEALDNFRAAMKLSPRDPIFGWFNNGMAASLFHLSRYEESVEWARKALQYPNSPWLIRAFLVSALTHLERDEDSAKALADLLGLQPDCTISLVQRLLLTTDDAYREHLFEGLRKAGLPEG